MRYDHDDYSDRSDHFRNPGWRDRHKGSRDITDSTGYADNSIETDCTGHTDHTLETEADNRAGLRRNPESC